MNFVAAMLGMINWLGTRIMLVVCILGHGPTTLIYFGKTTSPKCILKSILSGAGGVNDTAANKNANGFGKDNATDDFGRLSYGKKNKKRNPLVPRATFLDLSMVSCPRARLCSSPSFLSSPAFTVALSITLISSAPRS